MSVGRAFAIGLLAVSAAAAPVARQRVGASRTALATVIDGRGRPILAIDPDDFVVRETGQQRDVLSVRVADYPIALVLDNSVAGAQDFPAVREAAARFVGRIGHRPIVLALTTPPQVAATLDDERATVLDRIGTARASEPGAGLLEAVAAAARALVENGSAFSVIVVISASPADGEPGAVLGPVVESGGAVHVIVNATFEG